MLNKIPCRGSEQENANAQREHHGGRQICPKAQFCECEKGLVPEIGAVADKAYGDQRPRAKPPADPRLGRRKKDNQRRAQRWDQRVSPGKRRRGGKKQGSSEDQSQPDGCKHLVRSNRDMPLMDGCSHERTYHQLPHAIRREKKGRRRIGPEHPLSKQETNGADDKDRWSDERVPQSVKQQYRKGEYEVILLLDAQTPSMDERLQLSLRREIVLHPIKAIIGGEKRSVTDASEKMHKVRRQEP